MSDKLHDPAADESAPNACADWAQDAAPYVGAGAALVLMEIKAPAVVAAFGGVHAAENSAPFLENLCHWASENLESAFQGNMQGSYVLDKIGDPNGDGHYGDQHSADDNQGGGFSAPATADDYGGGGASDGGGGGSDSGGDDGANS